MKKYLCLVVFFISGCSEINKERVFIVYLALDEVFIDLKKGLRHELKNSNLIIKSYDAAISKQIYTSLSPFMSF